MRDLVSAICACAAVMWFTGSAEAQSDFAWPDGQRAAIVLTYDDSAPSQLEFAVPQLDAAGLKGTFFLTGNNMPPESIPAWRAVADGGHELANHTITHPCLAGTYDMPARYTSESYDVATMLAEIRTMNAFLTALDGKPTHAFGAPCGHKIAGDEDFYGPLIESGMATYYRDEGVPPVAAHGPPMMAIGPSEVSGAELIGWVEQVRNAGALGIIVFHGVGGDYLAVSAEAHQELVAYLAAHPRDYWVPTFSEMMDSISKPAN